MGMIRKEIEGNSTPYLKKKYHTFNTEGRKAAYDELVKRGEHREANLLRYGKVKKPVKKKTNTAYGLPVFRPIKFNLFR